MQSVLPVRRSAFNAPAIPAAPAAFLVLVRRGAADAELALRGEHRGDLAGARRHAVVACQAVADRFDVPATAEVLDAAGAVRFRCAAAVACQVGLAAAGGGLW